MENSNYLNFQREKNVTIDSITWDKELPVRINATSCGILTIKDVDFSQGLIIIGSFKKLIIHNIKGNIFNSHIKCEELELCSTSINCLELDNCTFEGLKKVTVATSKKFDIQHATI